MKKASISSCEALRIGLFALFLCSLQHCEAWALSSLPPGRAAGSKHITMIQQPPRMDSEGPMIPYSVPAWLPKKSPLRSSTVLQNFGFRVSSPRPHRQRLGHGMYGLPWKKSIVPNVTLGCVYMPFWEWQCSLMQDSLQNVQLLHNASSYVESTSGQHRMVTLSATSDEYRLIRMTYLDGGDKLQIFTSVWYPRGNLPLFGVDALQFQQGKRHLAICDFQPLHDKESDHDAMYEHLLQPIRQAVPQLQEQMTDRFFDPNRYFSNQTLLGRFSNTAGAGSQANTDHLDPQEIVWSQLWPAYKAYLQKHIEMVQQTRKQPHKCTLSQSQILEHHRSYDNYVAQCDPAHPMFTSIFGIDVAENYVYDVLFPLADKPARNSKTCT